MQLTSLGTSPTITYMKTKPRYQEIFENLRQSILSGERGSEKLPSVQMLMRKYHVTRTTVTRVMEELSAANLIFRKQGSGTFIRPNSGQEKFCVASIVAGTRAWEYYLPINSAIVAASRENNLTFLWSECRDFSMMDLRVSAKRFAERFRAENVRGVFFLPYEISPDGATNTRNRELVEALDASGIKIVLIDRDIVPFPGRSRYDLVGSDHVNIGHSQARHLIENGSKKLIYVSKAHYPPEQNARFIGMRCAVAEAGLSTPPLYFAGNADNPRFVRSVIQAKPDGIVFISDDFARTFINTLQEISGKRIAFRYIGVDGIPLARKCALATLQQASRSIGEEAVRLMALRLRNDQSEPRQTLFPATLIPRASSML